MQGTDRTFRFAALALVFLTTIAMAGRASAEGPDVDLELVINGAVSPEMPQRWLPVLAAAGFNQPSIRSAQSGDTMEISNTGTPERPHFKVRGTLSTGGVIHLPPGRQFSLRDTVALADWVRKLKAQGPETTAGGDMPFDLTPSRLEEVKKDLGRVVTVGTRGAEPPAALGAIAQGLNIPLVVEEKARLALAGSGAVRDELQGFASGTAIAALIRPAGLVLRPRFSNGRTEYLVTDGRGAGDNWPVGWKTSQSPGQLVPGLFEKEETQEVEVTLGAALKELEGRIKAPLLYDYNSLAVNGVDLSQVKVTLKAGKTYYGRILSRALTKAKLDYEVRIDDAGRPFLWISSARRS